MRDECDSGKVLNEAVLFFGFRVQLDVAEHGGIWDVVHGWMVSFAVRVNSTSDGVRLPFVVLANPDVIRGGLLPAVIDVFVFSLDVQPKV